MTHMTKQILYAALENLRMDLNGHDEAALSLVRAFTGMPLTTEDAQTLIIDAETSLQKEDTYEYP